MQIWCLPDLFKLVLTPSSKFQELLLTAILKSIEFKSLST